MRANASGSRISCTVFSFLAAVALTACTDKETVFVERPFFEDPPANAAGFLGYGTADARAASFTVCGNCHIGTQSEWKNTKHASAWSTLQANANAQASCEGCHSVSERGNAAEGAVAWAATADARYEDVQCESCHGPGAGHVSNPEASQPLASVAVNVDLTNGCGECHSGAHHPFLDEWVESRHGFAGRESIRGRDGCNSCHEGRQALVAFGENVDYIEKTGSELQPIVCAVCHDPHNARNPKQLRFSISVPDVNQNLCMKCHQKRAVPELEAPQRGPHSPQGPLLLGEEVGWQPPGFDLNGIRGSHGSSANPRLCATCHVSPREVTDLTGSFVFNATGHSFEPIPCVDAQGVPTGASDCALTERSWASCTGSGCHGDATAVRSAYQTRFTDVNRLIADLAGQLAQVPSSEFDRNDGIYTTAEGALFNQRLAEIRSSPVHNPFMVTALLLASIQAVEDDYGISPNIAPAEIKRRLEDLDRLRN